MVPADKDARDEYNDRRQGALDSNSVSEFTRVMQHGKIAASSTDGKGLHDLYNATTSGVAENWVHQSLDKEVHRQSLQQSGARLKSRLQELTKYPDYVHVREEGSVSAKHAHKFIGRRSNDPKFRHRVTNKEAPRHRREVERSSYDDKVLPKMLTAKDRVRGHEQDARSRVRDSSQENQIFMPYESAMGLAPTILGSATGGASASELRSHKQVNDLQRSRDTSSGSFMAKDQRSNSNAV